jgi:hypothetical protein
MIYYEDIFNLIENMMIIVTFQEILMVFWIQQESSYDIPMGSYLYILYQNVFISNQMDGHYICYIFLCRKILNELCQYTNFFVDKQLHI